MAKTNSAVFFVTGKGGVGKSYLAGILARGAAEGGLRTLLVRTHPTVATMPSPSDNNCQGLETIDLDPRSSLHALLTRTLRFRFLSDRLMDSRTFGAVAAAAPGLTDLVTLSAITDLAHRDATAAADVIIVDAPASGHSLPLLSSPARILELVRVGPVAAIARASLEMITDIDHCRVVIATLPEELCISEATLLARDIRALGIELAPPIVNGVYPEFADARQQAWLEREFSSLQALSKDATMYLRICKRQRELIERFRRNVGPALCVPFSFSGRSAEAVDPAAGTFPSALDATALVEKIFEGAV